MFEFVRSHTRLFQILLFLLVFPSFVFFGVQGYSRFSEPGMRAVATVDGQAITQSDWDLAHQRWLDQMRRQMPGMDVKMFDTPQARQETLDKLVRERVMLAEAQSGHLAPGDERLQRLFRTDPQLAGLRNPDGTVNKEVLAAQGLSSEAFAAQLRTDLGMRQVMAGLGSASILPQAAASRMLETWLQRREIELERFMAAEYAPKLKPGDAELESWYQTNQAKLLLPEAAQIEYVVLSLDAIKAGVQLAEAEVAKFYEDNAARYTAAEERRASHILVTASKDQPAAEREKARKKAEELLAQVRKAPASFGEVARKHSQDPGSAERGGDLDFFGRGAMVKPFEDKAFSMKAGEISDLVESDFGYHIIRLEAVRGGQRKPLAEVRAEIEQTLRTQQAQRRFAEAAEQFTNTVYEQSDSLQPALDKFKLARQTATVQRTPAPGAQGPLGSAKLLEAVFAADSLKNKRNTEAIEVAPGVLVGARVAEHKPSALQPFEQISAALAKKLTLQQASQLAAQEGRAKLAALREGKDAQITWSAPQMVSRGDPRNIPIEAMRQAFKTDAGKLPAYGGVEGPAGGYFLVRVSKVQEPGEIARDKQNAIGQTLRQVSAQSEASAYLASLRKKADVKIRKEEVERKQ